VQRAILTQLAGMVSGAERHGHPLSIAIVDLDDFKAVNDEHGHQTGDHVLVAAVRAMRAHLSAEDQLGRLGGEEFPVLLPAPTPRPPCASPRSCAWRSPRRPCRCS
jgi:diguanylate cyclase (GGDEF)-like protein